MKGGAGPIVIGLVWPEKVNQGVFTGTALFAVILDLFRASVNAECSQAEYP
jgi:hypothetical protein